MLDERICSEKLSHTKTCSAGSDGDFVRLCSEGRYSSSACRIFIGIWGWIPILESVSQEVTVGPMNFRTFLLQLLGQDMNLFYSLGATQAFLQLLLGDSSSHVWCEDVSI